MARIAVRSSSRDVVFSETSSLPKIDVSPRRPRSGACCKADAARGERLRRSVIDRSRDVVWGAESPSLDLPQLNQDILRACVLETCRGAVIGRNSNRNVNTVFIVDWLILTQA
jgi:hypothetical protein